MKNKKITRRHAWILLGMSMGILMLGICLLFGLSKDERFSHVMNGDSYLSTEDFARHFSMDVEKAIRYTKLAEKLETDGELDLGAEIAEIQVSEDVITSVTLQNAIEYGERLGLCFDEENHLVTDDGNIRWDVNLPPEANLANMLGEELPEGAVKERQLDEAQADQAAQTGEKTEVTEFSAVEEFSLKEKTEEEFLARVDADAYDPETGEYIRYPSESRAEREAEEREENKLLLKLLYQLAEYYELDKYFGVDEPVGNFAYRFVYVNAQEKVVVASNRMDSGSVQDMIDLGYYFWMNSEREDLAYTFYSDAVSRVYTAVERGGLIAGETYEIVAGVDINFPRMDSYAEGRMDYRNFQWMINGSWAVFILGILCFLVSFICLLYSGRKCLHALDLWYTEAMLVVLAVEIFLFLWSGMVIRDSFRDHDVATLCTGLFFGCILVVPVVCGLESLIRRFRLHEFIQKSLILWAGRELLNSYQNILRGRFSIFWALVIYLGGNICLAGFFVLVVENFLVTGDLGAVRLLLLAVSGALLLILNGIAFIYAAKRASHGRRISEALLAISEGAVDTKVNSEGMFGQDKGLADTINTISDGLVKALEEQTRSERMKTDLIANVSHDLRTPLTSIINYVDLLKREQLDNPKAKEYLDILESKSQRMKQLTEDLMEASKVSSGNMTVNWTRIDLVQMVNQMEGEFQEKFEAAELTPVSELMAPPVYIMADGRLLFRVLENLYNNVCKYAMRGTRVYIDLKETSHKAVFTMKNISADPLNISADELTGRFVRGDVSRSTEGSGLGLSIAQSITKLLKGNFEIYLEGDLFRVRLIFPLDEEDRS